MEQCDLRLVLPAKREDFLKLLRQTFEKVIVHIGGSMYDSPSKNFSLTMWTDGEDLVEITLHDAIASRTSVRIPIRWKTTERKATNVDRTETE